MDCEKKNPSIGDQHFVGAHVRSPGVDLSPTRNQVGAVRRGGK